MAGSTAYALGEDYATLALAFLYAGAKNVVSTLWPIEDNGAGVFAEHFYSHLRDSEPVDALAGAQRQMLLDEDFYAPFYWAGYQLAGTGSIPRDAQISGR